MLDTATSSVAASPSVPQGTSAQVVSAHSATAPAASTAPVVLALRDVHAWYGQSHVLHGMNLQVRQGELVTLLGRNGAGRTTSLRAMLGLVGRSSGSIQVKGQEVLGWPSHRIARTGLGYCPEERGIFASLSCEENLMLVPQLGQNPMSLDEIYSLFPNLAERRKSPGTRLSGGEQQMLAMARILRSGAEILLLDEITEGLAPVIVKKLGEVIRTLKQRGLTMVLVEQNFHFARDLADRHCIVEHGAVVYEIARHELASQQETLKTFLGV